MPTKKSEAAFYRPLLTDAWRIAWRHKHLWVFGFFATIIGFGGVSESVFSSSDRVYAIVPGTMSNALPTQAIPGLATLRAVTQASASPAVAFMVALAVLAFFGAVFVWITYVAVGALVTSVRSIERGGDASFAEALKEGAQRFWPVLGINLSASVAVFSCFVLMAYVTADFLVTGGLMRALFFLASFILFTLLTLAISVTAVFATCEAAVKGRGVRDAIRRGIAGVRDHWLAVTETLLALFVTSLGIGLASVLAALIISVPFVFLLLIAAAANAQAAWVLVLVAASAVMLAIIVTVGSLITTYQAAAWTLLWSRVGLSKVSPSKLLRLVRRHAPYLG